MRRGRLEIMLDILDKVGHGETKITRIMYATKTTVSTLYRYMDHLMGKGLIEKKQGKYVLTEEGHIALKHGIDFKWAVLP
jgi:Predicted transcriptional regulator